MQVQYKRTKLEVVRDFIDEQPEVACALVGFLGFVLGAIIF